jgi:hypothetical protein
MTKYLRLVDVIYPNGRAVGYDYGVLPASVRESF